MNQDNASPQLSPPVGSMFPKSPRDRAGAKVGQRKVNKAAQKREELRDGLWPGSANLIWSRFTNDGFTTIPRLLPLVMRLIDSLAGKGAPSGVYLDLWTRVYDEGIVKILDEEAYAYSSGYSGTRAVRTWREHVQKLADIGFIKIKPQGSREIAHILLLNPLTVCAELYRAKPLAVTEEWWTAFVQRAVEIGAKIPAGEKQE
jgi:hypothetical protein